MNELNNKKWNKILNSISDERFREDVNCLANLIISLSKDFSLKKDEEGKLYCPVNRYNNDARRLLNAVLSEEMGITAFYLLKDYVSGSPINLKIEQNINHAIDVCLYFKKKMLMIIDKENRFSSKFEDIEDIESEWNKKYIMKENLQF